MTIKLQLNALLKKSNKDKYLCSENWMRIGLKRKQLGSNVLDPNCQF